MEIINLKCNNCGADLTIKPHVKFFNCNSCKSSLTIKKTDNTIYTEVIGEIKKNTDQLVNDSTKMLYEKELERLDREWLINREKYSVNLENGNQIPDKNTIIFTVMGTIIFIIFFIFWFIMLLSSPDDDSWGKTFLFFFGIMMLIFAIVAAYLGISNTNDYYKAEKKYKKERKILMNKLK